jgi:hypothetical protein
MVSVPTFVRGSSGISPSGFQVEIDTDRLARAEDHPDPAVRSLVDTRTGTFEVARSYGCFALVVLTPGRVFLRRTSLSLSCITILVHAR